MCVYSLSYPSCKALYASNTCKVGTCSLYPAAVRYRSELQAAIDATKASFGSHVDRFYYLCRGYGRTSKMRPYLILILRLPQNLFPYKISVRFTLRSQCPSLQCALENVWISDRRKLYKITQYSSLIPRRWKP
jgi:hypothetical protein